MWRLLCACIVYMCVCVCNIRSGKGRNDEFFLHGLLIRNGCVSEWTLLYVLRIPYSRVHQSLRVRVQCVQTPRGLSTLSRVQCLPDDKKSDIVLFSVKFIRHRNKCILS